MTGSEISAAGDEILRGVGAAVFNFSHNRALPKSLRGLPDKLVFFQGVTYWIEVKGDGDTIKPDQVKFFQIVQPNLNYYNRYVLADGVDVFMVLATGACRKIEVPGKWLDKLMSKRN